VLNNIQADQSSTVSFEIAPTYPVNVSVTGLVGSGLTEDSVELQNNGGDPILVTADATVNFPTELPDGAMYDVTVASQPDNQTCTVANGTGTVSGGPVFGPAVTCVDNSDNISWFATSITFLNGDTGTVTATITCNAGLPLTQSFDISEGSPVEFTVSELKIDAAGTTCEITASDAGYDVLGSANAETPAASCLFNTSNFAVDGRNTCEFVATPMPTTLTVNTAIDGGGDSAIDESFTTTLTCTNVSPDADDTFGTESISSDTSPLVVDWYSVPGGTSQCSVVMVPNSPALEGGECSFSFMQGDAGAGCEVTGVVFFEGIPTLSQWAMAIMALLMLGFGFVGLRRYG
jgi:hypothetical protein